MLKQGSCSSVLLLIFNTEEDIEDNVIDPDHFLTHWGQVTQICVSKLTINGSDNGLSPDRRQAIVWANAGILLIGPFGTNFSEISIEIVIFSFKKMHLKVSSVKRRPFCFGLNVLTKIYDSSYLKLLLFVMLLTGFCVIWFQWTGFSIIKMLPVLWLCS